MPTIGVSLCRKHLDDYVKSIANAGGTPRVLDPGADNAAAVLGSVDGLLFTGGCDVDPARYGETPHPTVSLADLDRQRDAFEIELIQAAAGAKLPMFGICRGLQILNVAFGGSLIQDVPSQTPTTVQHAKPTPLFAIAHEVWITRGSTLASLMPDKLADTDACAVNSRHHQAINRVADGFEVTATAPDGIIEAIEHRKLPFCVAVQWHPENFWRTGEFRELFEGFIGVCEKARL